MTYDKFGVLIGFANESGKFVDVGREDPLYYNDISLQGRGKNRFFKGVGGRMLHATSFSADFAMQGEINKKAGGVDPDKQYKKKDALNCSINIEFFITDNNVDGGLGGLSGFSGMGDPYLFMSDDIISGNGTGKNFFPIYAGEQVFNKCYLQNFNVEIKPFQPVLCKASFKSFDPPTSGSGSQLRGLPIHQEGGSLNSGMSADSFVYGHTCQLSGVWDQITDVDAISQISFSRTYRRKEIYCLGSPEPRESLVTNVENQITIKGTGLKGMMSDEGLKLQSGLGVIFYNSLGNRIQTEPLANGVTYNLDQGIAMKSGAFIVGQSFSNKAGGTTESSVTIREAII